MKEFSHGFRKKYKILQKLVYIMITMRLRMFQEASSVSTFLKKSSKRSIQKVKKSIPKEMSLTKA